MCYSSTASFVTSLMLLCSGIIAVYRTKKNNNMLLACIPLLFAFQQCIEGVVWIALHENNNIFSSYIFFIKNCATYVYLFFVFVIWPSYIPIAVIMSNRIYNDILLYVSTLLSGIVLSVTMLILLLLYPVHSEIVQHHLRHTIDIPFLLWIPIGIFYLWATIVPFLASKKRYLQLFGILLAISYVISFFFYFNNIISIWCFFAALLSVLLIVYIE